MNDGIGWRFPPTNGGRVDGFNDPGIAHFSGQPLSSLARETIQNSLDARLEPDKPVHVSFELIDVNPDEVGRDELFKAITKCMDSTSDSDRRVATALQKASDTIRSDAIPCLRISDRNTSGLGGQQWGALVKMQGASFKADIAGAGGSFGIGKYAPFAVSNLRTVFYWTCYQEEESDRVMEKFQGKSVMMSHKHNQEETQGTGFFGYRENCRELLASDPIPHCFRVLDLEGRPIRGTSLGIWGFDPRDNWRRRIATSVIENYFYAISTRQLEITMEPSDDEGDSDDMMTIDAGSLDNWFDYVTEGIQGDRQDLDLARALCDLSREAPTVEKQDQDLGHCKLWIRVETGLPKRVAIVRRSGMLVTARQPRLIRFDGYSDFVALVVFEDPAGNELLRGMENPRHDKFEPQRLPESEQKKGRQALHRITRWIRDQIKERAGPEAGGKETVLTELATYLPDYRTDEPFDAADEPDPSGSEPGIGDRITVSLRPIRRIRSQVKAADTDAGYDDDYDGDDVGQSGGGGLTPESTEGTGTGGSGDGDGSGGTGGKGGDGRQRANVGVQGVRIIDVGRPEENRYRVRFRPDRTGIARLTFSELGDSIAVGRTDIRAADPARTIEQVSLVSGQDVSVEIVASTPLLDCAWRVSAELIGDDLGQD